MTRVANARIVVARGRERRGNGAQGVKIDAAEGGGLKKVKIKERRLAKKGRRAGSGGGWTRNGTRMEAPAAAVDATITKNDRRDRGRVRG